MLISRAAESAILRQLLEGPTPSLAVLSGPPGVGKAGVIRNATRGLPVVRYWAASVPDTDHRALLVERLGDWSAAGARGAGGQLPPAADWATIFDHLLLRLGARSGTLRLVLEEFPTLVEARPRLVAELERFWRAVRSRGLPVHLVLTGGESRLHRCFGGEENPFSAWIEHELPLRPLGYREVGALFPGYSDRERLLAWCVFGGLPRRLRWCDPHHTLATNVRQATLAPDSPLLMEGSERLQMELQAVARYTTLLRSLASGHREWRAHQHSAREVKWLPTSLGSRRWAWYKERLPWTQPLGRAAVGIGSPTPS